MQLKQIQIDFDLFCDLYAYFYENHKDFDPSSDIWYRIEDKMDKVVARELFTKYKRAATPEEREAARKKYLDYRGISKSFRTDKEERGI